MEEDLRSFEFLAINSKEVIEKQVDSYRQQHSYAGTIIGFTVLFIPFFLNSLAGSNKGVGLTTIAILISIILLLVSTFLAIEKAPTKIQVVNTVKKPTSGVPKDSVGLDEYIKAGQ